MRPYKYLLVLFLLPFLALLLSVPGCGKAKKPAGGSGDLEDFSDKGSKDSGETAKKELPSMGYASLRGLVTYEGEKPQVGTLRPEMEKHKDAAHCLMGKEDEIIEQTWIVGGPNKGVANVVIFLKAPKDSYFKIDKKKVEEPVEIRQPHCAFMPHVVALFPEYYDGKGFVPTGQVLKVVNDAKMSHNTKISGDPDKNSPINKTLLPGSHEPVVLKPQAKPLEIACNFHNWMSAKAWVFDNPYHAVTKGDAEKDKAEDFGKYEIPEVPAGIEVNVVAWHQGAGFIWGENGKKMTFQQGEKKDLNFSIQKK